ncbi:MAG TPA: sodium transporter, partial [Flavisolibacter sp.]|nr:sodium transporter [Flavisolibacter sp.]
MFILGMFWKRTTGAAAVAGLITGFVLAIFFNSYAVDLFGKETLLYTAYEYQKAGEHGAVETVREIPFLINMGWSFFFTLVVMVGLSLAGPKVNPKSFVLDKAMFKLKPATIGLIAVTLLILTALYARFW